MKEAKQKYQNGEWQASYLRVVLEKNLFFFSNDVFYSWKKKLFFIKIFFFFIFFSKISF